MGRNTSCFGPILAGGGQEGPKTAPETLQKVVRDPKSGLFVVLALGQKVEKMTTFFLSISSIVDPLKLNIFEKNTHPKTPQNGRFGPI